MGNLSVEFVGLDNDFARSTANALAARDDIQVSGVSFEPPTPETTAVGSRITIQHGGAGMGEAAPGTVHDLTIYVPTISSLQPWMGASPSELEREFDSVLHRCFRHARQRAVQYMRQRRGTLVFCTPQYRRPTGELSASERRALEQKQAVHEEGLYALMKVIALEFASKGVRAHFAEIRPHSSPERFCALLPWMAHRDSAFSTGMRIAVNE